MKLLRGEHRMHKVLIYSGTTEGRLLAERLAKAGLFCDVCVATEYGEQVMPEQDGINVRMGRLTPEQMSELYKENDYLAVVDATHPFAVVVTENIRKSLELHDIPYFRLARDIINTEKGNAECVYFEDSVECAAALKKTTGNILLTTGSKELKVFCEDDALRKRIICRVLPGRESLELCYENGLEGKQIIAMQGPFSTEMNLATIKQYNISYMVTKESGKTGGVDTKLAAAEEAGIPIFMIRKPGYDSGIVELSAGQVISEIAKLANIEIAGNCQLDIVLGGIGMGNENSMTIELQKRIQTSDYIFGASRMIETFDAKMKKYPYYLEKDIIPCLLEIKSKSFGTVKVTILFSGDSGFFSGCEKMVKALEKIENIKIEVIPGIASISALSAKVKVSWQDAYIVSTHGVDEAQWMAKLMFGLKHKAKIFFITSGYQDIQKIGRLLIESGMESSFTMKIGYQLSYENEWVKELKPEECLNIEEKGLYVGVMLKNEYSCVNKSQITPGWSDDVFIRDRVPLTKEEVRTISICKLKLTENSVVYDVGSGTGSVAIEVAALSPEIKVYAIETNPVAVELTKTNVGKFGVSNVTVIEAMAPEGFDKLPAPTHAFIGGSKGNLREILEKLYQKNPHMRIVMNAISMENICLMNELLNIMPVKNVDITNLSVAKAKEVGEYHLLQANNPVMVFAFEFDEDRMACF